MHLPLHLLPTAGLEAHLEANWLKHGPHRFRQITAGAVATGVPEGKGGSQGALVANAVTAHLPTRLVKQGVGVNRIPILEGGGLVQPGQAFYRAVGGDGMSFQQLVGQQLAVDDVVDGAAHRHVRGHVVADGITLGIFFTRRRNGEDDAAVLYTRPHPELEGSRHGGRQ